MRDTQLLINTDKDIQKEMPVKEVKEEQKAFDEELQKLLKDEVAKSPITPWASLLCVHTFPIATH